MARFWKTALALVLTLMTFESAAHGWGRPRKVCSSDRSATVASPLNYHALYADVEHTYVTIKDVYLRTADGKVVRVPGDEREIDLQDLQGLGKGFNISLAGVQLPDNAASTNVVEIEVPLLRQNARLEIANQDDCDLKIPHKLNLYAGTAPFSVIAGQPYRVGVTFSAIDDVQINDVTTTTVKTCCDHEFRGCRAKHRHTSSDCESDTSTSVERECRIANRRHLMNKLVRPQDEF